MLSTKNAALLVIVSFWQDRFLYNTCRHQIRHFLKIKINDEVGFLIFTSFMLAISLRRSFTDINFYRLSIDSFDFLTICHVELTV